MIYDVPKIKKKINLLKCLTIILNISNCVQFYACNLYPTIFGSYNINIFIYLNYVKIGSQRK